MAGSSPDDSATFAHPHPLVNIKYIQNAACRARWFLPAGRLFSRRAGAGSFLCPQTRWCCRACPLCFTLVSWARACPRLEPKDADCAAKLKKRTLTNLYNERPAWPDLAHKKLDATVAAAYGWPADLTDEQILEKLLALNLERAAAEAKVTKVKKPRTTRAKNEDEMI